jgi:hypothetical protein
MWVYICLIKQTNNTNNMKATIKTKNAYTWPSYSVMLGKEVLKAFRSKKDAVQFRNQYNNNNA